MSANPSADISSSSAFDEALFEAIAAGDSRSFEALFNSARQSLEPSSRSGFPLSLAAAVRHGDLASLALLAPISNQSSLDRALELASGPGHVNLACRLLEAGANPEAAVALASAIRVGDRPGAQRLLGAGASPNAGDALAHACSLSDPQSARLLLEAGANPNAIDESGKSPLCHALSYALSPSKIRFLGLQERGLERLARGREIANALLAAGADASVSRGRLLPDGALWLPPLAGAIRLQDESLIASLIERGAEAEWLFDARDSQAAMAPFLLFLEKNGGKEAKACLHLAKSLALARSRGLASPAPSPSPVAAPSPSFAPAPLPPSSLSSLSLPRPLEPAPAPPAAGPVSALSLPAALLDDSPEALREALDQADRMERHIALLRAQAGILSLARALSEHPSVTTFQLHRLYSRDDPANPEEYHFIVTNRGVTEQAIESRKSQAQLRSFPRPDALTVALDPDAGTPNDQLALDALEAWIQAQPQGSLRRLFAPRKALQSPPPGSSEPLAHALLRQALSPQELAAWEAASLARELPSGSQAAQEPSPPASPDLSRLEQARGRKILGSGKSPSL